MRLESPSSGGYNRTLHFLPEVSSMDQIGEILLKLAITEREAQLALREIERNALNREIEDPRTDPGRRSEALLRRNRSLVEWGAIMTELQDLRDVQQRETTPVPRTVRN
jgi:hypothetical protein